MSKPKTFSQFKNEYKSYLKSNFEERFGFNNKIFTLIGNKELMTFLKDEYSEYCDDFLMSEIDSEQFISQSIENNFN